MFLDDVAIAPGARFMAARLRGDIELSLLAVYFERHSAQTRAFYGPGVLPNAR
jgi:hypothetical protein